MDGIIARLRRAYPDQHNQGNFGIRVRSLREDRLGDARPVLFILLGAVGLVLLIACANVANLMLARGERGSGRWRSAPRSAASRFRIVRQLLTEACVLSLPAPPPGSLVAWLLNARSCRSGHQPCRV